MTDAPEQSTTVIPPEDGDTPMESTPPKAIPRNRRGKIDHSDPDHRCSADHVRVPAHCRLKKNKRKRIPRPSSLAQTV